MPQCSKLCVLFLLILSHCKESKIILLSFFSRNFKRFLILTRAVIHAVHSVFVFVCSCLIFSLYVSEEFSSACNFLFAGLFLLMCPSVLLSWISWARSVCSSSQTQYETKFWANCKNTLRFHIVSLLSALCLCYSLAFCYNPIFFFFDWHSFKNKETRVESRMMSEEEKRDRRKKETQQAGKTAWKAGKVAFFLSMFLLLLLSCTGDGRPHYRSSQYL